VRREHRTIGIPRGLLEFAPLDLDVGVFIKVAPRTRRT
jgi:hypothetical protein